MTTPPLDLDGRSVVGLTTKGRVTGRPHKIEIWFAHNETTVYMLSGGRRRSDWVRNIIANPAVTVRTDGIDHEGRGRIVDDSDEQRLARDLVFTKYSASYGGDLTGWRDSALPIAVDLNGSVRAGPIPSGSPHSRPHRRNNGDTLPS